MTAIDESTPKEPSPTTLADEDDDARVARQLREHGVRLGRGLIAPAVFWPALAIVATVSVLGVIAPEQVGRQLNSIQGWIVTNLGWYYILAVAFFLLVSLFIGMSKYGRVVIGKEGDEPEFGLLPWFAMLFAAGMGIGLVFYGVAEPLSFATTETKPGVGDGQEERAHAAFAQTFVHWGVHAWSIYVIVGLALALAIHRRGRPVSIRWALEPIFGDRVKGWIGDVIDILAIVGTVFGVATSLGLGVQQIAAGLSEMGVVGESTDLLLVGLIVVITLVATVSVASGLAKGIKWLSNINIGMAGLLVLAVLLLGPTLFILRNMVESIGVYLASVLPLTFDTSTYAGGEGQTWQSTWSIFYWGWWISWAPFVGVFIARISRGRTVREFVAGALLVPMAVTVVWFSVMGGAGVHREFFGGGGLVEDGAVTAESALVQMLQELPLGPLLSVVAIVLVVIFFVTSSDSGSLVVDMLASGGHPNPPVWSRVLWVVVEGVVATVLLLAGGLSALQAGAITTALPFSVVMVLMVFALFRALRTDLRLLQVTEWRERRQEFAGELEENFPVVFGPHVDERIDYKLSATKGARRFERQRPRER
jgi:choline/glycine/proline betaine transport protein